MSNVVVTGASSGVGAAPACLYAWRRDACAAEAPVAESARVHVRNRTALQMLLGDFDDRLPLDVVVAHAGVTNVLAPGAVVEPADAVEGALTTNLLGAFNSVASAAGPMAARGAGRIGLVRSIARMRGLPHSPAHSASKAGSKAMGDAMHGRLRKHGVWVAIALLGFVATLLQRIKISTRGNDNNNA